MPAVHHKLLLEEALQDSPQVGLRWLVLFTGAAAAAVWLQGS